MEDLKEGKQKKFLNAPPPGISFVRPMGEDVALSLEPLLPAPKVTNIRFGNSAVCQSSQHGDTANGGALFRKLPSSDQHKVVAAVRVVSDCATMATNVLLGDPSSGLFADDRHK